MNKQLLCWLLMLAYSQIFAQVNYTANDQVTPYDGYFRPGTNLGFNPPWDDAQLADIAAGNSALDISGIGAKTIRPGLYESVLDVFGYDFRLNTFQHFENLGLKDNTCIVGFPSDRHRDTTEHCDGIRSELFSNLYEPIWDNGENGTPVNDENHYALYLYEVVTRYKDYVKFWEIWNEPGFDYTFEGGWLPPDQPGNWWENGPDPCDYKLRAPIQEYIRMLRISWEIVKTYDPDSYVAVAGVGYASFLDALLRYTDNPDGGIATPEYPLGGGAYFDVMGFHSYPHVDGSMQYWDFDLNGFVYSRNSDAGADGVANRKANWQAILAQYGYDGITHPEKEWIITEMNIPRVAYGDYIGSDRAAANFIIKAMVACMQNDIHQMHIYDLADKTLVYEAYNEFDLMGLYEYITGSLPYSQVKTKQGIAYKTVSDELFETVFDPIQTALLNLNDEMKGGAFLKEDGTYVYALWAKTQYDQTEDALAYYTFPSSLNMTSLNKKGWDFSETQLEETISPDSVELRGEPIFLYDLNNENLPDLSQPTVQLNVATSFLSEPFTVSAIFSEDITDFTTSDLTITNGTASNLIGSGTTYSFTVTPTTQGIVSIQLPEGSVFDLGNNPNKISDLLVVEYFPLYVSMAAPLVANGPYNVHITFNNPITGLTADDFDITNATITNLFGDGVDFDMTILPITQGNVLLNLPENSVNDAFGNFNSASNNLSTFYEAIYSDTIDLELNLSVDNPAPQPYTSITFTLDVFNNSSADATDIVIDVPFPDGFVWVNGTTTLGSVDAFTEMWDIDTLQADQTASLSLTLYNTNQAIPADVFAQVIAASPNDIDSTPDNANCISTCIANEDDEVAMVLNNNPNDTSAPIISLSTANNTVNESFIVNVSINEPVVDLDVNDFAITNAVASNLTNAGTFYSFTATPINAGTVTVQLPADAITDVSGNGNIVSNIIFINYVPISEDIVDLELNMTVDDYNYQIYETVSYSLTVTNTSDQLATQIEVSLPYPSSLAHVSQNVGTGSYANWTGTWSIDQLAPNSSADLSITLFTLSDNAPITLFAEVSNMFENDEDSTPGNGPNDEDDEASITISTDTPITDTTPPTINLDGPIAVNNTFSITIDANEPITDLSADDFVITNGTASNLIGSSDSYTIDITPSIEGEVTVVLPANTVVDTAANANLTSNLLSIDYSTTVQDGVDISLNVSVDDPFYGIYENVVYTFTIQNTGNMPASGVEVSFPLPEGLVQSYSSASAGYYSSWVGIWFVGELPAGAVEVLELSLFTLVEGSDITAFIEVLSMNETDVDSEAGNGAMGEDDEATITISPSGSSFALVVKDSNQQKQFSIHSIYPNPTDNELNLLINSQDDYSVSFSVQDFSGKTVLVKSLDLKVGYNPVLIDVSNFSSGIYTILFDSGKEHQPIRFLKQRE